MSMRTIQSMGIACLFAGGIWAADDPFVGTWKLNQEKSKIAGEQMKSRTLAITNTRSASARSPIPSLPTARISQFTSEEPGRSRKKEQTPGKWSRRTMVK
jgi:hypothetical protein